MFGSSARAPFGGNTSNASFGFGSTNQNPFGQSQNMFGATTSSSFGTPAPAFGQTATPMFGTPQQSAPLFGSPAAPAFGATNQPAFGTTNLFSQPSQPQSSTSLFGNTGATSFVQPNKPGGFNFPSSQPGLFGQTATPTQSSNMFQPSTSANIFGSSGFGNQPTQTGTGIKFVPFNGTDSMQKSGNTTIINTRHHSITCMKEYEMKSFEELRFEDYVANRKGPQQSGGFGATTQPFGPVASTAPSLFGQPDNKTAFGGNNSFGQTSAFGLTSQPGTSQGVFGKPTNAFGSTITTASGFGFPNTQSTSIFGQANTAAKPFGTQPAQPLFGTSQPQPSAFGSNTFFSPGTTNQQSFFNKPTQPAFPSTQPGNYSFGPTATQPNSLFQPPKTTTAFTSLFQTTNTTPGFGQTNAPSFGGFGNTFVKPAQTGFGQPTQPATTPFGGMQGGSLFVGLGNKQPSFGTTGTQLFTGPTNTSFSMQPQPTAQQPTLGASAQQNDLRTFISHSDPYGFSPHLEGLTRIKPADTYYVTNPKEIADVLNTQDHAPALANMKKLKVLSPARENRNRWEMYEQAYEAENYYGPLHSNSKDNPKRLVLKNKPEKPEPIMVYRDGKLVDGNSHNSQTNVLALMPTSFTINILNNNSIEETPEKINSMVDKSVETEIRSEATARPEKINEAIETEVEIIPPPAEKPKAVQPSVYDTCGIKCTRPEYYTIPALKEISNYINEDGTCVIQGFTIGRIGYGNVHFPDRMDVSNLNIDDIVHFRFREICVYHDDDTKPPLGEGLNRRAQVTLDMVFPKKDDKSTEEEHDPDVIMSMDFNSVLKTACIRAGSTFVDYRPETGSWVFNVQHFSKYGLTDHEEEESRNDVQNKKAMDEKGKQLEEEQKRKMQELTESLEQLRKRGLGGTMKINSNQQSLFKLSTASQSYKITSVIDPVVDILSDDEEKLPNNSSVYMRSVFFNEDMDTCDSNDSNSTVKPTLPVHKRAEMHFDDAESLDSFQQQIVKDKNYDILSKGEPKVKLKLKRYRVNNVIVPLCKSLVPQRGVADIAMLKSRSFKVGWGRGFTFTMLNAATRKIRIMNLTDLTADVAKKHDPFGKSADIELFMEIMLKESSYALQRNYYGPKMPLYNVNRSTKMLKNFNKLAQNIAQNRSTDITDYYANIWSLCVTLWGDDHDNDYNSRRDLFNQWLEVATSKSVGRDLSKHQFPNEKILLKQIMLHLSGHQISKASDIALNISIPQLGLLISQLNCNGRAKYALRYQMGNWHNTSSIEFIQDDILKLYLLTCGEAVYKDVNVFQDMDWLRCLAIYFWYLTPSSQPLTVAIKMFEKAFDERDIAEKPFPIHASSRDTWDVLYHIMKLYCNNRTNLNALLASSTHTDNPTDYRLSWLLQQVFISINVGLIDDKVTIHINTLFATQLENMGLFKWAIFVTCFIPDLVTRKNLVLAILDRNITEGCSNAIEYELYDELAVPMEWIHYVKAMRENQLGNYWSSYRHLANSQAWQECHEVAVQHIFPILVANHQFVILDEILSELSEFSKHIYRWNKRGSIICSFCQYWKLMHESVNTTPPQFEEEAALAIHNQMVILINNLRFYPAINGPQKMIVSEISKFTSIFYHALLMKVAKSKNEYYKSSLKVLKMLAMPADYKFQELVRTILYQYRN